MSDVPTGLRAKPLSRLDRSAGHLLVIAVVIFIGAAGWRQYHMVREGAQQRAVNAKAAILLVQAQVTESGLQVVHELPPGGEWRAVPGKDTGGWTYVVVYEVGERKWRWTVDLDAWTAREIKYPMTSSR